MCCSLEASLNLTTNNKHSDSRTLLYNGDKLHVAVCVSSRLLVNRTLQGVNCTAAASPSHDLTSPCIVNITTPRLSIMLLQRCTTTTSNRPHVRILWVFKTCKVSTLPYTKTQLKYAKSTIHI
jgi:hypothetical protein